MSEIDSNSDLERNHSTVDSWVNTLSTKDVLEPIDRQLLKSALGAHGASFEFGEFTRGVLASYKNADRAPAMRMVWGERLADFKKWSESYALDWEERNGLVLPTIRQESKKEPGKILVFKNSGMIQFFGTLTALGGLSEEQYPFEEAKRLTEARAVNGRAWAEGRKKERKPVKVPSSKDEKLLSSYPPGFPSDSWEYIKTWK